MTNRFKFWLIIVLTLIVLTGIYFAGYFTYKNSHPCLISYDTTYVRDTIIHTIINQVPYYVQKLDTVFISDTVLIPADADSIDIAFYSTSQYTRTFEDTLLKATLEDRVTQNKPAVISFDYTIKRPQTVIQNIDKSVNYNKYLLLGLNVPFKDMSYGKAELTYVAPKWYVGAGYMPKMQSLTVKAGITLFKFK